MRSTTTEISGLTTRVVDNLPEGEAPSLLVVLCHGFGATGQDLVPIGHEILTRSHKLSNKLQFYFPEGPLDLSSIGMYGCRAWWNIDVEAINIALQTGGFRQRARDDQPEGLVERRIQLTKFIDKIRMDTNLAADRVVLGGFSQGCMLTTDVTFHLSSTPAALLAWSGTLLNETEWRKQGQKHAGLKVLQSHGVADDLLPYEWAEYLRDVYRDAGMQVEFIKHDGAHAIPMEAIERTVGLLEDLIQT
ncbi:MAG: alpha/beta hydrolase [Planctomycetota bacterium]|jgi:phospholipase/carboxylesterase